MDTNTVGFIGQGWIGRHYADNFEERGYEVVRYALEEPYVSNRTLIRSCSVVFVAVPTPTTPEGFSLGAVRSALAECSEGTIVVIKSTLLPGSTTLLQSEFPDLFVIHIPEFLSEATVRHDVDFPDRTIVGIPIDTDDYRAHAQTVIAVCPRAPYTQVVSSVEAELIKYAHNIAGVFRILFVNTLYDLAQYHDASFDTIRQAISADPWNGPAYTTPVHKGGRGAGGDCFIKDLAAYRFVFERDLPELREIISVLRAMEAMNVHLLGTTHKNLDLLRGVYGADIVQRYETHHGGK